MRGRHACGNGGLRGQHLSEESYKPNPVLVKALNTLFILHADHELNCSTAAMRHISSSQVDPYSAIAGAAAALYGPLHGGACEVCVCARTRTYLVGPPQPLALLNRHAVLSRPPPPGRAYATQAVLRMLEQIGSVEKVPAFIEGVKKRERKLMGFGHRIYKNYDPRARIIKETAYEVRAFASGFARTSSFRCARPSPWDRACRHTALTCADCARERYDVGSARSALEPRCSRSAAGSRLSTSRSPWKTSRCRTRTLSSASCTPTWTFTLA